MMAELNRGNHEALLQRAASDVTHHYPGRHALGGTRRSVDGMRRWFERSQIIFPDLQFDIKKILVTGWPWLTTVAVQWTEHAHPADGREFHNSGVSVMRLRWGKLVELRSYVDTQLIAETFQRLVTYGVTEAGAPPIEH